MLKVSQLMRLDVYRPKRGGEGDPTKLAPADLSPIGKVRQVVFAPREARVVGLLLRRPDVAGMVRREDAFVALDAIAPCSVGFVITRGAESLDGEARTRLGLDWDACVLWTGMDAKTTDGKELGWVSDVEFNTKTGRVRAFYVGDGSVAKSLVGRVQIPGSMLRGYKDGYMLVDPEAARLALDGGLAAKAGESYARAKADGKKAAARAGKAAGTAVEKGARAVGKKLGRTKGMFGSFMDEYKKASK